MRARWWSVPLLVAVAGCAHDWDSLPAVGVTDVGVTDVGVTDVGVTVEDVSVEDVTVTRDAGAADDGRSIDDLGGSVDAGLVDAGLVDADLMDADPVDAGLMDAGLVDAGPVDAGLVDAGPVDVPRDTAVDRPPDPCPAAGLALCDGACRDLRSDPIHCGACGRACRTPINGSTMCRAGACVVTCAAGFQELPSHDCATFGGATSSNGEGSACGVNPLAGACACPDGFTAGPTYVIRGRTEHASTGSFDASLRLCQVAAPAGAGDWGGSYLYRRSVLPLASDCVTGNSYRGMACACPDGFAEIQQLPVLVGLNDRPLDLYLCSRPPAPGQTRTYLGAYVTLLGDFVTASMGGTSCLSPNVLTGGCRCPAGARSVTVRSMAAGVFISGTTATRSSTAPAMITVCMR